MAISQNNIVLFASQRMTDTEDGGGPVTGTVIVGGVSNNLFPDISELDRTLGRFNWRQAFPAVTTADTDSYMGAHVIISQAPADPLVHATLFTMRDWTATRSQAVDRMESYLARGPLFPGILFDQHIAGQKALLVLMEVSEPLVTTGTTIVVVKNPGLSTEDSQFVRVTGVDSVIRTFSLSPCGSKTFNVVTLYISDPLAFDALGGSPSCVYSQPTTCKLYSTVVADAAVYYGIRPVSGTLAVGDYTITADTIFGVLVPSAQTEIPITDVKPNGDSVVYLPSGAGTISFNSTYTFDPTTGLHVGQSIMPGTLTITAAPYSLVDKGGVLMSGTTPIGLVDYSNGVVTINSGGPSIGGTKAVVYRPAAAPTRNTQTASWSVTTESRSQTVVTYLDPIPTPGSLAVHFMSQGNWYVIRDDGSGAIRGVDSSYGVGIVSFTTGSVSVTLGALPDVGSSVIFTYGLPYADTSRAGVTVALFQDIQLAGTNAIVPGLVTLAWGVDKVATDDGNGNLQGDATGTVNYADRTIRLIPTLIPAAGTTFSITVGETSTARSYFPVVTQAGGRLTGSLGEAVRPKTLYLNLSIPQTFLMW